MNHEEEVLLNAVDEVLRHTEMCGSLAVERCHIVPRFAINTLRNAKIKYMAARVQVEREEGETD